MTEYSPDDNFDNIVGAFLKCPRGKWLLDGVEIPVGPTGTRPTILMTTARHGVVHWENSRPITNGLKLYVDCDPPQDKLAADLNPYTVFQCLIDGELATFASSSWGARKAFKKIVDNYRYVHRREFPTVALGTKPRNDVNGNIDPTFSSIAWIPIGDFADMLPEADERPQLAPATAPIKAPAALAAKVDQAPPIESVDGPFAGPDNPDDIDF